MVPTAKLPPTVRRGRCPVGSGLHRDLIDLLFRELAVVAACLLLAGGLCGGAIVWVLHVR